MKFERVVGRRNGFSLTELLVVIAIIVILITLLFPTIQELKEKAYAIGCANNARQIGIANVEFMNEHNGLMPGPNWRKPNSHGWLYFNLKMDQKDDLATGQLWPYINEWRVYRCPKDPVPNYSLPRGHPDTLPNRPNNSNMITSYCMNGSVISYGQNPFEDNEWLTHPFMSFKPDDIIFWEVEGYFEGYSNVAVGWWHDAANYPHEGISGRHYGKGTLVCADGHAEWMRPEDWHEGRSRSRPNRWYNNRRDY